MAKSKLIDEINAFRERLDLFHRTILSNITSEARSPPSRISSSSSDSDEPLPTLISQSPRLPVPLRKPNRSRSARTPPAVPLFQVRRSDESSSDSDTFRRPIVRFRGPASSSGSEISFRPPEPDVLAFPDRTSDEEVPPSEFDSPSSAIPAIGRRMRTPKTIGRRSPVSPTRDPQSEEEDDGGGATEEEEDVNDD
jgi:hypothetical protein